MIKDVLISSWFFYYLIKAKEMHYTDERIIDYLMPMIGFIFSIEQLILVWLKSRQMRKLSKSSEKASVIFFNERTNMHILNSINSELLSI